MIWILLALGAAAGFYQLMALLASWRQLRRRAVAAVGPLPGVSVLKPIHGWKPGFEEALESHLSQKYPEFELLAGHASPNDSAAPALDRAGVPHFVCPRETPNRKAGVLAGLLEHARYPILIVNDADIVVPAGYIADVTAPLADPEIGVVTCLYRAEGDSIPSRFEALGVATDFAPSALVAPYFGVAEFGFGSTLALRRRDLEAIGGFAALADSLADDYQLGARIHRLGRRNVLSPVVVKTRLHTAGWGEVWSHQVRWARTIRVSRWGGYIGLPVTFATFWALLLAAFGLPWIAAGLLCLRLAAAIVCGYGVLGSPDVIKHFWAIPLRDLFGAGVWVAGLFGDTVEWGGRTLRLDSRGRIVSG